MKEVGLLGILLGAVGALLAIFLAELVKTAFKTRVVAFKTSAYLSAMHSSMAEKDWIGFSVLAKTWGDERRNALRTMAGRKSTEADLKVLEDIDKKYQDGL